MNASVAPVKHTDLETGFRSALLRGHMMPGLGLAAARIPTAHAEAPASVAPTKDQTPTIQKSGSGM